MFVYIYIYIYIFALYFVQWVTRKFRSHDPHTPYADVLPPKYVMLYKLTLYIQKYIYSLLS